jgi:putative Holliday junction resolvase
MAQQRVAALGLDIGTRRIGVAGCDGLGLIATGLTTIARTSWAQDVTQLRQIIQQRQVEVLVIGLSYRSDGGLTKQGEKTKQLAEKLAQEFQLPVVYVNEHLTSVEAEELIISSGIRPRDNKALVDRKAAAIILQQWLDEGRPGQKF